jgi:hypothetical protein
MKINLLFAPSIFFVVFAVLSFRESGADAPPILPQSFALTSQDLCQYDKVTFSPTAKFALFEKKSFGRNGLVSTGDEIALLDTKCVMQSSVENCGRIYSSPDGLAILKWLQNDDGFFALQQQSGIRKFQYIPSELQFVWEENYIQLPKHISDTIIKLDSNNTIKKDLSLLLNENIFKNKSSIAASGVVNDVQFFFETAEGSTKLNYISNGRKFSTKIPYKIFMENLDSLTGASVPNSYISRNENFLEVYKNLNSNLPAIEKDMLSFHSKEIYIDDLIFYLNNFLKERNDSILSNAAFSGRNFSFITKNVRGQNSVFIGEYSGQRKIKKLCSGEFNSEKISLSLIEMGNETRSVPALYLKNGHHSNGLVVFFIGGPSSSVVQSFSSQVMQSYIQKKNDILIVSYSGTTDGGIETALRLNNDPIFQISEDVKAVGKFLEKYHGETTIYTHGESFGALPSLMLSNSLCNKNGKNFFFVPYLKSRRPSDWIDSSSRWEPSVNFQEKFERDFLGIKNEIDRETFNKKIFKILENRCSKRNSLFIFGSDDPISNEADLKNRNATDDVFVIDGNHSTVFVDKKFIEILNSGL